MGTIEKRGDEGVVGSVTSEEKRGRVARIYRVWRHVCPRRLHNPDRVFVFGEARQPYSIYILLLAYCK